jgi:DNA polymerase III epsilon subunit-like protein
MQQICTHIKAFEALWNTVNSRQHLACTALWNVVSVTPQCRVLQTLVASCNILTRYCQKHLSLARLQWPATGCCCCHYGVGGWQPHTHHTDATAAAAAAAALLHCCTNHSAIQPQTHVTPSAQYTDVNINGTNGSRSPSRTICPRVQYSSNPTEHAHNHPYSPKVDMYNSKLT